MKQKALYCDHNKFVVCEIFKKEKDDRFTLFLYYSKNIHNLSIETISSLINQDLTNPLLIKKVNKDNARGKHAYARAKLFPICIGNLELSPLKEKKEIEFVTQNNANINSIVGYARPSILKSEYIIDNLTRESLENIFTYFNFKQASIESENSKAL